MVKLFLGNVALSPLSHGYSLHTGESGIWRTAGRLIWPK